MNFDSYLGRIPDYRTFLTVDELDAGTQRLARLYPESVRVFTAGRSANGHPIYCLKIGDGPKNALAFGCPHPNEPIGAMMLESFAALLAENRDLRDTLGFTWYIVKTSDPDGTKLNEGWFKGPFTIYNYARHYYRPAMDHQVEWTFPIHYKNLDFQRPTPETQALMGIIDRIKPQFLYSLHNAGFGGVFWYVSKEDPDLYTKLPDIAGKYGIPLSMGEPEVPYSKLLGPAVYRLIGMRDMYDFYEQQTDHPEKLISCGTSSNDYANGVGDTLTLVSELPYFYDPRIDDTSETKMIRKDAVLKSCDIWDSAIRFVGGLYGEIERDVSGDNPFRQALGDFLHAGAAEFAAKRQWAVSARELEVPAKVSEVFDNLNVSHFYSLLFLALLVRLPEYELAHAPQTIGPEAQERLNRVFAQAEAELKKQADALEREMNYTVVPIKKLVSIQLESGFLAVSALNGKDKA